MPPGIGGRFPVEPRCPRCTTADIAPTRMAPGAHWACNRCGAAFPPGDALVTVDDLHAAWPTDEPRGFTLVVARALDEMRRTDGAIRPVNRFSDPDELNDLVVDALEASIIEARTRDGYLRVVPSAVERPGPFLVVEPGAGAPALAGGDLPVADHEDPVQFTVEFLRLVADRADRVSSRLFAIRRGAATRIQEPTAGQTGHLEKSTVSSGNREEPPALPSSVDATTERHERSEAERQRDVEGVILATLIEAFPTGVTEADVRREVTSVERTPERSKMIDLAIEELIKVGLVARDDDSLRPTPPALRSGELGL